MFIYMLYIVYIHTSVRHICSTNNNLPPPTKAKTHHPPGPPPKKKKQAIPFFSNIHGLFSSSSHGCPWEPSPPGKAPPVRTSRGVTLGRDPAKEVTKLDSEPERSCRGNLGWEHVEGFVKNYTPSETRKTSSNI